MALEEKAIHEKGIGKKVVTEVSTNPFPLVYAVEQSTIYQSNITSFKP